jgi:hypothetical protein
MNVSSDLGTSLGIARSLGEAGSQISRHAPKREEGSRGHVYTQAVVG